jgi:GT2 family glycosyltransferase
MKPTQRMTSIIVPCWNQLSFTLLCLEALFRHTRPPWELIVVDNGSTDGTGLYLAGVRDSVSVPVTLIGNERNVGFPRAINQGLEAAAGEYLVLLNNDAIVTEGWLDRLILLSSAHVPTTSESDDEDDGGLLTANGTNDAKARRGNGMGALIEQGRRDQRGGRDRRAEIGLLGPMSNYATPPQLVENVPYRTVHELHAFARRWRDEHLGQWFTATKLSGFCILMKRAVCEAIGGLDERFGMGLFDDDDLAMRARRAGFELAVARDLFVHHFGSRTFAGNGIDAGPLREENARQFAAKSGHHAPAGRQLTSWMEIG